MSTKVSMSPGALNEFNSTSGNAFCGCEVCECVDCTCGTATLANCSCGSSCNCTGVCGC